MFYFNFDVQDSDNIWDSQLKQFLILLKSPHWLEMRLVPYKMMQVQSESAGRALLCCWGHRGTDGAGQVPSPSNASALCIAGGSCQHPTAWETTGPAHTDLGYCYPTLRSYHCIYPSFHLQGVPFCSDVLKQRLCANVLFLKSMLTICEASFVLGL